MSMPQPAPSSPQEKPLGVHFDPQLLSGVLIKRYKRFLADVQLTSGQAITVHCPNTGPLTGLVCPGTRVWIAPRPGGLGYRWQVAWDDKAQSYVGVDTHIPNLLVMDALKSGYFSSIFGAISHVQAEVRLPDWAEPLGPLDRPSSGGLDDEGPGDGKSKDGLTASATASSKGSSKSSSTGSSTAKAKTASVKADVSHGPGSVRSRLDFLVQTETGPVYIEVKNVHMRRADSACFPDAPTPRGTRHLGDLSRLKAAGHRAVLLYIVQRSDCQSLCLASDIDPAYSKAFFSPDPIEAYAWSCQVTPQAITLKKAMSIQVPDHPL
jgi:sugar fermentation stimulation protein A